MQTRLIGFGVGCIALLAAAGVRAQDGDPRVLVKEVLDAIPKNSFVAKLTLSSDAFAPREIQMSRKYIDGMHGSYLEVVAPDELEGIRFLFLERPSGEHEQYIKVKASRQAVRVQEGVRTQPFLGSAFYVSDLVMPGMNGQELGVALRADHRPVPRSVADHQLPPDPRGQPELRTGRFPRPRRAQPAPGAQGGRLGENANG